MKLVDRVKSAIKVRNDFNLDYNGTITADFGDFVPIVLTEAVPTDVFTVRPSAFFRLAPLASPSFGKIHGYINSFFVPYRILMPRDEYEDSMTGGLEGDYPETFPFITRRALLDIYAFIEDRGDASDLKRVRKIFSYVGLGNILSELHATYAAYEADHTEAELETFLSSLDTVDNSISLLPFLALFRIFYDYYAPMNIEEDANLRAIFTHQYKGLITKENNYDDIERLALGFMLLTTCYNKDYFTMAMTRPQRGAAEAVSVQQEDVLNTSMSGSLLYTEDSTLNVNSVAPKTGTQINLYGFEDNPPSVSDFSANAGEMELSSPNGTLDVDKDSRVDVNVLNDRLGSFRVQALRLAERIQSFLETNNIAGGRFFEQMLARFGVKMSPKTLQRSEYLGGHDFWVSVSDVTSTSDTSGASLGDMAGKGIALGKSSVKYGADDYGFFISILHFVPETFGLVDGISRMWTRHSKFDYWIPELEDTGMQPVFNRELNRHHFTYPLSMDANPDGVFGYNPRDAEYKVALPLIGGDFVLNSGVYSAEVLQSFNLFRRVGLGDTVDGDIETPILSRDFVSILGYDAGHNNFDRIFQNTSPTFDHFFIDLQVRMTANRPMIGYAEGGLEFAHENKGNKSVSLAYGGMRL